MNSEQLKSKCISLFGENYGKKFFKELTSHFNEMHIICSVTQEGTDAPTVSYQRNDTGIDIEFTYSAEGTFVAHHPLFPMDLDRLSHIVNAYDTRDNAGIVKTQHKLGAGPSSTIYVTTALIAFPAVPANDVLEHTPFHIIIFA